MEMSDPIQDDLAIRSKETIGSDVAWPLQTALVKVIVLERDGILIPDGLTGDLAEDEVIPFQSGQDQGRPLFGVG